MLFNMCVCVCVYEYSTKTIFPHAQFFTIRFCSFFHMELLFIVIQIRNNIIIIVIIIISSIINTKKVKALQSKTDTVQGGRTGGRGVGEGGMDSQQEHL